MLLPVSTAWAGSRLTSTDIKGIVEEAKILSPEFRECQVVLGEGEAAVSIYRNPKASDRDCKIDAVLILKKILDADPNAISRLVVRFHDPTNPGRFRQVIVQAANVKAFGRGEFGQDKLLSMTAITMGERESPLARLSATPYKDLTQSADVLPGVYRGERLQLYGRIEALRHRGVGVSPLTAEFFRIEDKVRRGDEASVINGMNSLSEKLSAQEESYNRSHPVRSSSTHGSRAPAATDDASDSGILERMRSELGDLAPGLGPELRRRYSVARRILALKEEGRVVDEDLRVYREIEELAAKNDPSALNIKLRYEEHRLGLPSVE